MPDPARDSYLTTEVFTASPQRLHLMLVEAAIRCVQRAAACWQAEEPQRAAEAIIHAEEVLGNLLAGLNRDIGGDLVAKTAAVYTFVFRSLMEANARRDPRKLDDALRVLAIERDTWRQLCEQLGAEDSRAKGRPDAVSFHQAEAIRPPSVPPLPLDVPAAEHYAGRFSLDA
jgi:flagellar secretion chaperone FliS